MPAVLAVFESLLLLDMFCDWRWTLHRLLIGLALRRGIYAKRHNPQAIALAVLLGVFMAGLGYARRLYRGRPWALMAIGGVFFSLALWVTEVISLHEMDRLLYHAAGPFMEISFAWIFASLVTSAGILKDAFRSRFWQRTRDLRSTPGCPILA